MMVFSALIVFTVLLLGIYFAVSAYNRPVHDAGLSEEQRKLTIQLCAHILAADDTGWVMPEPVVDLAIKILAAKEPSS